MLKNKKTTTVLAFTMAQCCIHANLVPDVVFIMLMNVKMPIIVGILTFTSIINFMLSLVEHDESFISLGPEHYILPNKSLARILLSRPGFNIYGTFYLL